MLLALSLLILRSAAAQIPMAVDTAAERDLEMPVEPTPAFEDEEEAAFYLRMQGERYYGQGRFVAALRPLQRAFAVSPSEEVASAIYYSLLYTGQSLEAQSFRNAHPLTAYALPPSRRRAEYSYAEGGVKMPAERTATNLFYGSAGAGFRFSFPLRLRQHFYYWRQPNGESGFHQLESRTGAEWYLGRGWLLLPLLHYVYQPFRTDSAISRPVRYTAEYRDGPDVYRYQTSALQQLNTVSNGRNHYLGFSLGLQKRIGPVELGLAPALQYAPGSYRFQYSYVSNGSTDSSLNGAFLGSAPFTETGSGSGDTAYRQWIFQLGASIGWRPPLRKAPLYLRAAAYGLRNNDGYSVGAADFYALVQLKPVLWLHLSALYKSGLPLLTGSEGIYLNYAARISKRFGGTLQCWPLRHFTPSLTYQFEELQHSSGLSVYHSVYLTFCYQP